MANTSLSSDQLVSLLASAPPQLSDLTGGLTPAHLTTAPAPGEWSANEVLAHLRACGDVWGDCISIILAEDRPTIRAVNPRSWISRTNYPAIDFQESLHAFSVQRADLLVLLEQLRPNEWLRAATLTGAGRPLEVTVHSYAVRLATHERPHLKQIARIIGVIKERG